MSNCGKFLEGLCRVPTFDPGACANCPDYEPTDLPPGITDIGEIEDDLLAAEEEEMGW